MTEMLVETIRDLTKSDENMMIPSEQILVLAKRIDAQRAQAAVINSLSEVNNMMTSIWRQKLATSVEMPARRRLKYCSMSHKLI